MAHRLERSGVLYRETAPPYEALIHEAALRMRFGGPKVAKAQLEHIQELSHLPQISVRVIPFATDGYIGSGHAMLYASGPVRQLDTVADRLGPRDQPAARGAAPGQLPHPVRQPHEGGPGPVPVT